VKTVSATVTSKGQITIPKEVRESIRVTAGDAVDFTVRDDGVVELRRRPSVTNALYGRLAAYGRPDGDDTGEIAADHAHERDLATRR
jgi:antitoxin PrlF